MEVDLSSAILVAAVAVLLFVTVYYMAAKKTAPGLALAAALGASGLALGAGSLMITRGADRGPEVTGRGEKRGGGRGGQNRRGKTRRKAAPGNPHRLAAKAKFTESEANAARALANGDPLPFPPPADYAGAKSEDAPTPPTLPFRARGGVPVARTHVGQRKLALAEVDFLARNAHLSRTVVYAGAGPGIHFPMIARLFPEHRFILYDLTPYKFADLAAARLKQFRLDPDAAESVMARVDARVGYFTDETAAELGAEFGGDVLFISDIRTGSSAWAPGLSDEAKWKKERAFEDQAMANQADQLRWAETMGFRAAQFKFRLPYGVGGDGKYAEGSAYEYADGVSAEAKWKKERAFEDQAMANQADQLRWAETMGFRLPYGVGGDGKYAEGSAYEYADGVAYLQAYAPVFSTETRLEVAGPVAPGGSVPRKQWDRAEYDEAMFYHNNIRREFGDYESVVEGGDSVGLGTSFDNAREVDMWLGYLSYAAGAGLADPAGFDWRDPESGGPAALAEYLSAVICRGLPDCKSGVRAVDRRTNCWTPKERNLLKAAGAPLGLP